MTLLDQSDSFGEDKTKMLMTVESNVKEDIGRALASLDSVLGTVEFESWIRPLCFSDYKDGAISLCAPTVFMADWVSRHYLPTLLEAFQGYIPDVNAVHIAANIYTQASDISEKALTSSNQEEHSVSLETVREQQAAAEQHSDDLDYFTALDPRFTFDSFVVGDSNRFAYAAARKLADSALLTPVGFNPLYFYAGVGLGKTHLMHAIGHEIKRRNPAKTVVYLSSERFMYYFLNAMKNRDVLSFKTRFKTVDVLMIDDVQFLIGKAATQQEFFNTFNALVDQGSQLILSADKAPSALGGMEDRLKARMSYGLVADIAETDIDLRYRILKSKLTSLNAFLSDEILQFLSEKITSNVRELEGALLRLVAHQELVGGEMTLVRAQDVLRDLFAHFEKRLSVDDIQRATADFFGIKISDLMSTKRDREIARPRQVAMYLCKALTSRSFPDIGRRFGRDHTTVLHAVSKVEELVKKDTDFAARVDLLRAKLS